MRLPPAARTMHFDSRHWVPTRRNWRSASAHRRTAVTWPACCGGAAAGGRPWHSSSLDRARSTLAWVAHSARANPVFGAALERCAALIDPLLGRSLLDLVCGREATSETLARTGYAQPALFALGWALTEMWRSYDVTPSLVMGHSVGEFTAACAAGVLSLEDAARLVVLRGQLMQDLPEGGAMAAVFAPEPVVRLCLAGAEGVVVISGVNAPDEVVVSGERDAVRSLCGRLAVDGIRAEPLTVSHAFHSPLMQPMISDFSGAARSIARAPRRLRIVSSVTGELADEAWGGPEYWVRQILAPVRFGDAMRSVIAAGADVVVEIGPHPILTALGRRSMPDSDVRWLPTLRRERDDQATVMASLAELYVRGATDDWSGETGARHRSRVEMPVYPFQRTRHWVDEGASERHGGPVQAASWCHPLLGARVALAVPEVVYQVEGGHTAHRSVRDHRIGGHIVWPAANRGDGTRCRARMFRCRSARGRGPATARACASAGRGDGAAADGDHCLGRGRSPRRVPCRRRP